MKTELKHGDIREYGAPDVIAHGMSTRTVLDSAPLKLDPRITVYLQKVSAGFEIAGSCARYTRECFAVQWTDSNGSTHGRTGGHIDAIGAEFMRLTNPRTTKEA